MSGKLNHYATRVSVFSVIVALIAGMVGFYGVGGDDAPPSHDLKIRTWYDLEAVTDNLAGHHTLMNDLDSTILGYEELASPTANQGKGWEPIGFFGAVVAPGAGCVGGGGVAPWWYGLTGTFDGQGYEIRDLFINRPDECHVSPIGLFGSINEGGIIKDVGVVNVTVTGCESVGGLAGWNYHGIVSNSYSTGSVNGNYYIGGLVGFNDGTVSNSYSTGSVNGQEHVGGLVGENDGTVSNSYSTGNVTGNSSVGGLVGVNYDGTVSNSYSTGSVNGQEHVGGLVGPNAGTVSNSFWDTETSGQSTSAGGTGKNTTEMQDIATFTGAGWNMIAVALNQINPGYIWNIVDGVTYPFLSWQSQLFISPGK